jgi:putative ABC transport system ATP-binding protein
MTTPLHAETMIDLRGVELTLKSRAGPVSILRGIDLNVRAGQSMSIVGPSGSGKSSLLMIITGLERATGGKVLVAGHDFSALDEGRLATVRGATIGIVFQSFHLIPTMTALENVALPLEFLNDPQAFDRARRALGDVGLAERLSHFPGQLSGGEQQRVALARAMVTKPKILIADEPTGNLDTDTGTQIIDLMFDLHRRDGATLILITHDQQLAAKCDRRLVMRNGRIVQSIERAPETAYA